MSPPLPTPSALSRTLLSVFGLGLAPVAPGTVASLACALLLWAVGTPLWAVAASIVAASAVTLWFGRDVTEANGHGDPGWVVADEWAGQALGGAALPLLGRGDDGLAWVAAFVTFRALDISKVGWVGRLERIPGPWGVLLDDLLAGVGAALVAGGVAALRM